MWFTKWFGSPYYHTLYYKRDNVEANNFIDKLLNHLQPKAQSLMLDVACGSGRHANYLAQKGYTVTGIDISPDAIKKALQHKNEYAEFFQHDMRLSYRINYYDYVFNFFTSFGYFDSWRDNMNALAAMSAAGKPQATLIIDYLNVAYSEQHLVPEEEMVINGIGFEIKRRYDENYFYKNITVLDNSLPNPLVFEERVEKITLPDFEKMFAAQNLKLMNTFGNYNLEPYHTLTSPRLVMQLQKQ